MIKLLALLMLVVGCETTDTVAAERFIEVEIPTGNRAYASDEEDAQANDMAKEQCLGLGYSAFALEHAIAGCFEYLDGTVKCTVYFKYKCKDPVKNKN